MCNSCSLGPPPPCPYHSAGPNLSTPEGPLAVVKGASLLYDKLVTVLSTLRLC